MDPSAALETLSRHTTHLKDQILARPILSGTLATLASSYLLAKLYRLSLKRSLSKHIPHVTDSSRQASVDVLEVESLPEQLLAHPKKFRIVHDKAVKVVPGPEVGLLLARGDVDELEAVFTEMMRRNMASYASTPQGWAIWFMLGGKSGLQRTFQAEYIDGLGFAYGDRVCGIWEVVKRKPLKVELALRVPEGLAKQMGPVGGLLVFSLRTRGDGAVLAMESAQYVLKDTGKALPLEGALSRWLHEVAAWRLLLQGDTFIQEAAKARK